MTDRHASPATGDAHGPPADAELRLLGQNSTLRAALAMTIELIRRQVESPPPSILNLARLLEDEPPVAQVAHDPAAGLAGLIAAMSRFLAHCSDMPAFRPLGLLDWVLLSAVRLDPGITDRQLCRQVGVGWKRLKRVLPVLVEAGFVRLEDRSTDRQIAAVFLTPVGEKHVSTVSGQVRNAIEDFVRRDPLKLPDAMRMLRELSRLHGV